MPKHLVTAVGLIVALGVIALGVFLVALPLYLQGVSVDAQTATVAGTNAVYQAQVDNLTAQQENFDQINSDVAQLRSQIPADGQFDDVFEVVGRAAEASGVQLTAITAGEQVVFVARGAVEGTEAAAPAPDPTPSATDAPTDTTGTATDASGSATPQANASRHQVDFTINATAGDMAAATAFLDALRSGPRLLNSVTATSTQSGEGTVSLQISALTYVDAEG